MALAKVVHIMPIETTFRDRTDGRLKPRFTYVKAYSESQTTPERLEVAGDLVQYSA